MTQPLYVFDMDETLVAGDCAMLWHEFLVEQGIVTQAGFVEEDKRLMTLYAQGQMSMQEYLDFSIKPIEHLPCEQIHALADACVKEKIAPKVFPQAQQLIQALKTQGISMLIISASVSFLVKAVANYLHVNEAIGIDLVIKDNHYLAQMQGIPSYQQGKVTRLQQWQAQQQNKRFSPIHFYTDSINDLALCLHADHVYLINPCKQLREQAQDKPWQILAW